MGKCFVVLFFLLGCSVFVTPCSIPGIFEGAWNHTVVSLLEISKKCSELVLVTVITNRYDTLKQAPVGWSRRVCSVAVVDPSTYQWIFGKREETNRDALELKSNGWTVIQEPKMYYKNNQCNVRTVKALLLKFLPFTRQAIYLDGTYTMIKSAKFFLDKHVTHNKTNLVFISHHKRHDVKVEMDTVVDYHLTPGEIVTRQYSDYSNQVQKKYHTTYLYQGNFHYRRNIRQVHAFECLWFSDIMDYSHRDQLSLPKAITDADLDKSTKVLTPRDAIEFLDQKPHADAVNREMTTKTVYPCRSSPKNERLNLL